MMYALGYVLLAAAMWVKISWSVAEGSCVASTIMSTLSDRTCGEVSGSEADKASMAITDCLLRRLHTVPSCLKSGSENCVKSLPSEVYSSYRGIRVKWSLLCDATQQTNILGRLNEAVKDTDSLRNKLGHAVREVEKAAVETVESGLRIGEMIDGIGGKVDGVYHEVEQKKDTIAHEAERVKDIMEKGADEMNRRIEEICEGVKRTRERKMRGGGVVVSAYGCLGGVVFAAGKGWRGVAGAILVVGSLVGEFSGLWIWKLRLGLLVYCTWLVVSLAAPVPPNSEQVFHDLDDSDDASRTCDCCYDDDYDAY